MRITRPLRHVLVRSRATAPSSCFLAYDIDCRLRFGAIVARMNATQEQLSRARPCTVLSLGRPCSCRYFSLDAHTYSSAAPAGGASRAPAALARCLCCGGRGGQAAPLWLVRRCRVERPCAARDVMRPVQVFCAHDGEPTVDLSTFSTRSS